MNKQNRNTLRNTDNRVVVAIREEAGGRDEIGEGEKKASENA